MIGTVPVLFVLQHIQLQLSHHQHAISNQSSRLRAINEGPGMNNFHSTYQTFEVDESR